MLEEIRREIKKAKEYADKSATHQQKAFKLLFEFGIEDPDMIETYAENADNLQEAIACYISYGEYSLDKLMEEIKRAGG